MCNSDFFLRIACLYNSDFITCNWALQVQGEKGKNCEFNSHFDFIITHNCDFVSRNYDFISRNSEK